MAFPYATLCVQGIKDGVTSEAPDTRIAIVEFARRDDARKAMQAMLR